MSEHANSDLLIRPITAADEDMINEFFSVMGGEARAFFNRGDGNRRDTIKFCRDPQPNEQYFLAEIDGLMAGLVFLWDLNTSIPWVGIAVRENLKGRHIGRRLLAYVQDYAKNHGKGGLQLTTHSANLRGQVLYETMGFQKIGFHGASGEFYYLFRYTDV